MGDKKDKEIPDDTPLEKIVPGQVYRCICEHGYTKSRREAILRRVDEDDCNWRFIDDNSELSYDWNVIEVKRFYGRKDCAN